MSTDETKMLQEISSYKHANKANKDERPVRSMGCNRTIKLEVQGLILSSKKTQNLFFYRFVSVISIYSLKLFQNRSIKI